MWQQPGNGYMVPPAYRYPYYGPPAPRQPSGGRIAMFVIALALSGVSWLFGIAGLLSSLSPANGEPVPYVMLGYGVVTVGFSAFCIYRAWRTQLRYLWSILLLITNVVLPIVLFVLLLGLFLVLFAGAAVTGGFG